MKRCIFVAPLLFALAGPVWVQERSSRMDPQLVEAVAKSGQRYLAAESAILAGLRAEPRALDTGGDPIARAIADALQSWVQNTAEVEAAFQYLDYAERRAAKSPLGKPPPLGVANYLSETFGNRLVGVFSVRLLKTPEWPRWKVIGILFYLQQQKAAAAVPVLLRYAGETSNAEYRKVALETIAIFADPALPKKAAEERMALEKSGKEAPGFLLEMEKRPQ